MLIKDVVRLTLMQRLLYWIEERESIRLKKEAGQPKPWTDDLILQNYCFCNVRRMDDKVSKWLLKNWYQPNFNHKNMLVACTLARHFNNPNTLAKVGFPKVWNPKRIKKIVRDLKASGVTVFNGAYMVKGIGTVDKTEMVVTNVCQPLYINPPTLDCSSLQRSVEALLPYWGLSSFMAGQVVADLRWAMRGLWEDRFVWAPIGPGSKRGMNRLLDRPLKAPIRQEEFEGELKILIYQCEQKLPKSVTNRLEAIDYQNCLCEFDKYSRVLLGEGVPKQKYQGI